MRRHRGRGRGRGRGRRRFGGRRKKRMGYARIARGGMRL